MNAERWKKIEDIFQSALDLSGDEREAFIRAECGGDAELLAEVRKFIARYETEDTFLESPVWTDSLMMQPSLKHQIASSLEKDLPPTSGESFIGRQIGVYRLTKEIGKGGMGIVYAAERADGEFYQKVAVKLIKRGMDTEFIVKRFRHERQIAATLNHPNIARLLDGGTTDDGLPYFVLEFIEGEPLYRFCEKNNFGIPERLKLFQQICAAVSYAHGKQIVHRDIKPGNILISGEGAPKLLDFGIAKILDPDLIHESIAPTATQMRLMTPEYASPEQVRGETITPASDQYSLGVLLYELVTGSRPYTFPSRAPHEIARIICEEEPSRPSTAGEQEIKANGRRRADGKPATNLRRVDQTLEKIILKTLRKNPVERYASVAELVGDIERYLNNQPITAESFSTGEEIFPRLAQQKSIAVLPFKVENAVAEIKDEDGEFLSVGLADALVTRFSNVRQFIVRPTSSILSYRSEGVDAFVAGEKLNVAFVLDGTLAKTEKRLRVSVRLLNIAEKSTVWTEDFDEELTDVLSLEDTISAKVAESLVPQLTGEERQRLGKGGTKSSKAHESFLRGRYHWNAFTEEGFRNSIAFYQKAIEIDSDYALAHAAIADYYVWLGMYGVLPAEEFYPPAKAAALRAIELDARLSEAYAALGLIHLYGEYDWQTSEEKILRAIELNPNNSIAHLWYSHNLFTQGRFDDGTKHIKRAIELDPLSFQNYNTFAWSKFFARDLDAALAETEKLIEKFPLSALSYFGKSYFSAYVGKTEEALRAAKKALELSDDSLFHVYGYAQALAADGRRAEVETLLEQSRLRHSKHHIFNYHSAVVYCLLKDKEKAFELLERALDRHESVLVWLGIEPSLDVLRDDARYFKLLEKLNHPVLKTVYKNRAEQKTLVKNYDEKVESPTPADAQKSIAVLPFKVLNAASGKDTESEEFLGVGLADALVTRLSNVRRFIVRPTSSVLRFAASGGDSLAAGEELKVGFVLDGSIVRTERQIRVSVQLLNVAEQSTVWAERFDEDFTDVLQLEDLISERVAESLVPQLTTGEIKILAKRGTENAEAYEAYLRGRFHWNTFTEEGFRQAIFYYQKAVELDPAYALAYAGIADYYIWLGVYGVVPPSVCYPAAKDAARRAIELDERLAEAYASLGFAELCGDFDWTEAEKNVTRAIELNPNYAIARLWYSYVLQTAGRFDEGIRQARQAIELDPLTYTNHHVLMWAFYFARRFDEAVEQASAVIEKFPDIGLAYFTRSWIERNIGRSADAVETSEKALQLSGESLFVSLGYAQALAGDGRRGEAERLLARIEAESAKQYLSYYQVALVYCYLKDKKKALDALERARSDNEGWLIWLKVEPALDLLRGEPRFIKLLNEIHSTKTVPDTVLQSVTTAPDAKEIEPMAALPAEIANQTAESKLTPKRRLPAPLKYALAAIGLIIAAFGLFHVVSHTTVDFSPETSWRDSFSSKMNVKRLTTSGTAIISAISPDGKRVVFSLREKEMQSLWMQEIDSGNTVQLIAPDRKDYVGLAFSPDGKFVYYDTYQSADAAWLLSRVAVAGGEPQEILKGVYRNVGFSPDGRQITYFTVDEKKKELNLFVAGINEDGAIESPKTLTTRRLPDYFTGNPSFSPDAKKIVYAASEVNEKGETTNLFSFNLDAGKEEKLGTRTFSEITGIAWRAREDEIVISANEKNTEPLQLWLVSYPSGEASKLTNNLTNYNGVSLAANSDALVTSKKTIASNIVTVDLTAPKIVGEIDAKQITPGVERQDGIKGINWTADGRIVYVARAEDEKSIRLINADGSGAQTFNVADANPANPILTRDNRYLFFVDEQGNESVIRRYELATGALAQITFGLALAPALTPDNQFLVYSAVNDVNKISLQRVSIDGGKPTELSSASVYRPAVSPDGRFIACFYNGDQFIGRWDIAVLNISGGIPVNIIKPPDTVNLQNPHERRLAWSPDSRSIFYVNDKGGVSNVFRIAIDGNQLPEKITNFAAGRIFEFAVAPDGKRLALARGSNSSDVVIFRNSK